MKRALLSLLGSLLLVPATLSAREKTIETEHLRLIYDEMTMSSLAQYAAQCFENALKFHRQLWDYTPTEKITVWLHDRSDFGNAGADAVPRNFVSVGIAPFNFVYETSPANERINTSMNHELTHVVALDRATGSDNFFRSIFAGKVEAKDTYPETILYSFLTAPRRASPRWYHEGIAVFLETWMAGGYGRAQGPYDEMVFRTMVRDSSFFYDPIGLSSEASKSNFIMGVNNYLYGTRFMSYLAYAYSPQSLIDWASRADGSRLYYASQFRKVFGKSLDDGWAEWIKWEHDFQTANLDSIRQYPTTPYRDLSDRALGSVSRVYYDPDTNELYAALQYPGTIAHIAAISLDDGSIRKITDVKGPAMFFVTSLTFDPATKTIFYTADNNEWRDIHSVNLRTGKKRILMKNERVGDLTFCPADSSIWGVRHFNGRCTLVRIPYPYTKWNQIYTWPQLTRDVYDIDISPDGTEIIGSVAEATGRHTLRRWQVASLLKGDPQDETLYDFEPSIPMNFTYSPDQKYIYGSSYHTGVSNVFRWNVEADSLECVSNAEDGFFRPLPISGDSVAVLRYTGDGFVPAMIEAEPLQDVSATTFLGQLTMARHPELAEWKAGRPSQVDIDAATVSTGDYVAWKHVGLASAYPIFQGYKDYPAYGLNFVLSDPIGDHKLDVSASYTPNTDVPSDERVHLSLAYKRFDWRANFKWNGASFYDLVGPTKTGRRGYLAGLGHTKVLLYDDRREMKLNADVSGHFDIERLPDAQNVASSSDQLYTGTVAIDYKNKRASVGAVDYEKGHSWTADVTASVVQKRFYPSALLDFDIGFPSVFPNSSLWIRTSQGVAPGGKGDPASGFRGKAEANFWFGGFGNNYVDHGDVKRYRKYYAFPGTELNAFGGTNFQKTTLEFNLPPLRFRRVGMTSFYATFARMSLFGTGIITNIDSDLYRAKAASVGSQIDLHFTLLSNMRMTLSTGYGVAFTEDNRPSDEFMISLKIL